MIPDIHPEDLLDRARNGDLSASEQQRLDEHMETCATCALELQAHADFELSGAPQSGDDERLALIADRVIAAQASQSPHSGGPGTMAATASSPPTPWTARVAVAAAVVLVFGGGAAALISFGLPMDAADSRPGRAVPKPQNRNSDVAKSVPDLELDRPKPDMAPAESAHEGDVSPESTKRSARTRPARRETTAAEFLQRAAAYRRAGRFADAARQYKELGKQFPGTREHHVSRVSLGRLLLDRQGRPRSALREFDAYLAKDPSGTLAEEARVGRALAYQRLGDRKRETAAWKSLLKRHPQTVYASRANERLKLLTP